MESGGVSDMSAASNAMGIAYHGSLFSDAEGSLVKRNLDTVSAEKPFFFEMAVQGFVLKSIIYDL